REDDVRQIVGRRLDWQVVARMRRDGGLVPLQPDHARGTRLDLLQRAGRRDDDPPARIVDHRAHTLDWTVGIEGHIRPAGFQYADDGGDQVDRAIEAHTDQRAA